MKRPEFEDFDDYALNGSKYSRHFYAPEWGEKGPRIVRISGKVCDRFLEVELMPVSLPINGSSLDRELLGRHDTGVDVFGAFSLAHKTVARSILDSVVTSSFPPEQPGIQVEEFAESR